MNIKKIKRKYATGHSIHCRILDYNRMEDLYICTVEKSLLQENIFAIEDLTVGQSVEGTVVEVISPGIMVKCGNVLGFVENLHLSNAAYSETIKSKFRVKQKVKARYYYYFVVCYVNNRLIYVLKKYFKYFFCR